MPLRRTHKGPRLLVNVYLSAEVVRRIDQDLAGCAVSSRSQLLADRLSVRYGRRDLVRELNRDLLEFVVPTDEPDANPRSSPDEARESGEHKVSFRVPHEVVRLIDHDAQRDGNLARRQYMARVLSELYDPQRSRERNGEEQLTLPISSRREPAA